VSTTPTKVALVTGSASGIGKAIVERLADDGHTVLLTDLPHIIDNLDTTVLPPTVETHALDVQNANSRATVIDTITQHHGKLDILVNCAGVGRDARLTNIKDEDLAFTLNINLFGAFSLIRQALPLMQTSGGGAIVNIASRAWLGIFGSGAYSASKGGLIGATRSLALEVGELGITANCIAPGYIATPLSATLPQEVLDKTLRSIPVQRGGVPEDIAAAVRYLVLEGAYMTGQVLTVCGGRSIGDPTSR
jgi:3-oxoacyl-[acyl-carrier protein] reductase